LEDKLVELSVKRTLEPIYEEAFEDVSYGYRPGRSQHQCLDALGRTIQQKRVSYLVEADIKGFFRHCKSQLDDQILGAPNRRPSGRTADQPDA
jgi:RNA-directed DNA polymerase